MTKIGAIKWLQIELISWVLFDSVWLLIWTERSWIYIKISINDIHSSLITNRPTECHLIRLKYWLMNCEWLIRRNTRLCWLIGFWCTSERLCFLKLNVTDVSILNSASLNGWHPALFGNTRVGYSQQQRIDGRRLNGIDWIHSNDCNW